MHTIWGGGCYDDKEDGSLTITSLHFDDENAHIDYNDASMSIME